LEQLGRTSWVEEEFSRLSAIKYTPQDTEWGFLSIKGNRTLDGRGLAILRSLSDFREDEAISRDRPPFKIFPDSVLISLASSPGTDLSKIKGIGRYARNPGAKGIAAAITSGVNSPRLRRPSKTNSRINFDPSSKGRENSNERLKLLKEWRFAHGNDLKIDASLLWPANSLKRLSKYPESMGSELESTEIRKWQKIEFADSLTRFVDSID
jgi:ribonuclease D